MRHLGTGGADRSHEQDGQCDAEEDRHHEEGQMEADVIGEHAQGKALAPQQRHSGSEGEWPEEVELLLDRE